MHAAILVLNVFLEHFTFGIYGLFDTQRNYSENNGVSVMDRVSRLKWRWGLYYVVVIVFNLSLNIDG